MMNLHALHSASFRHSRHRGFTFIEVVIATAMLAVLLAMIGQLVVLVKRHARTAEQHATALRIVENCLDEIANLPWDEINDERIASMTFSKGVRERWPQAELSGNVDSSSDPVEAKRVSLSLAMNPDSRAPSAKLTTWVYRTPNR